MQLKRDDDNNNQQTNGSVNDSSSYYSNSPSDGVEKSVGGNQYGGPATGNTPYGGPGAGNPVFVREKVWQGQHQRRSADR